MWVSSTGSYGRPRQPQGPVDAMVVQECKYGGIRVRNRIHRAAYIVSRHQGPSSWRSFWSSIIGGAGERVASRVGVLRVWLFVI